MHFGCEVFVFEELRLDHFDGRIVEKIRILGLVERDAHIVKVGIEMPYAHMMPSFHAPASNDATTPAIVRCGVGEIGQHFDLFKVEVRGVRF